MTDENMTTVATGIKPVVFVAHGKAIANTKDVAAFFEKAHKHVLRDIRKLIGEAPALSRSNFGPSEYVDERGKAQPTYDMDKTGFTLLAMGFAGPKALKFKLSYIAAFDRMEAELLEKKGPAIGGSLGEVEEVASLSAKMRLVELADRLWGRRAGQQQYLLQGLPIVPAMTEAMRQGDLLEPEKQGETAGNLHPAE